METTLSYRNETIKTTFTDEEARALASENGSKFAKDICSKKILSEGQRFWLHKLACEEHCKRNGVSTSTPKLDGVAEAIASMFSFAGQKLKRPNIRLLGPEGLEIRIYPSTTTPNTVNVYAGGEYVGRLLDGQWRPKAACPNWVEPALKKFASNPAESAKEFGKVLGRCCFCNKVLETKDSIVLGFGPVCGRRYGLIK